MEVFSKDSINKFLYQPVHIAPLAIFRIIFGALMFGSILRFVAKGWVYDLYVMPKFYFPFYGFEWIKPLSENGMYAIFGILAISSLFILLGFVYRFATIAFFLCFTYVELIDKTNYLNHYYFVSIVSFLLILVPAHRYFSLDVFRNPAIKITHVPGWIIGIFKFQLVIVYFYAGVAKLNYDWLFRAMPLQIWLPAKTHLPIIGWLFDYDWVAYVFSWFGAIYDLTIPFFLLNKRTRLVAFFFVIIFHVMTALLFPIGMFPYIMIVSTLIFFSEEFHKKIIYKFNRLINSKDKNEQNSLMVLAPISKKIMLSFLSIYFLFQIAVPFRYLFYPGQLFWTEQGYRFSWRVMLMEKAGTSFFYVKEPETGRQGEVMNCDYLTKNQEKMMATQPDMILQFAHFLKEEYQKNGIKNPEVRVDSYVTLNGSGSRLFIDSTIDLTKQKESFLSKNWILPFNRRTGK